MDSWMAATVSEKQWYLAVGDRTIGPVTTDLVMRGIRSGRVPLTAWACQVGASHWSALSSFSEFQVASAWCDTPDANGAPQQSRYGRSPLPGAVSPVDSAEGDLDQDSGVVAPPQTSSTPDSAVVERQSAHLAAGFAREDLFGNGETEPLPSFADEREGSAELATTAAEELNIDVQFEEEHESSVNWLERFQSYFLVGSEVELPDESKLLMSLRHTSRDTFLHDEALWNLSLCLAFGSDTIADASARTFFDAIGPEDGGERVEWICRTLLSKGFMPSGIPRSDGMRGIEILRQTCPPELRAAFEREATD